MPEEVAGGPRWQLMGPARLTMEARERVREGERENSFGWSSAGLGRAIGGRRGVGPVEEGDGWWLG